jgi:hypothetical protein
MVAQSRRGDHEMFPLVEVEGDAKGQEHGGMVLQHPL